MTDARTQWNNTFKVLTENNCKPYHRQAFTHERRKNKECSCIQLPEEFTTHTDAH
jgi:hypothetical protein